MDTSKFSNNSKILAGLVLLAVIIAGFLILYQPQQDPQKFQSPTCSETCFECDFQDICATEGIQLCSDNKCDAIQKTCKRALPSGCLSQDELFMKMYNDALGLAIDSNNVELCGNLGGADAVRCESEFYFSEFSEKKDASICGKIKNFDFRLKCLNWDNDKLNEALKTNDLAACDEIIGAKAKAECKKIVEKSSLGPLTPVEIKGQQSSQAAATQEDRSNGATTHAILGADPDNNKNTMTMATEVRIENEKINFSTLTVPVETNYWNGQSYPKNYYEWTTAENLALGYAYCRYPGLAVCRPECDCFLGGEDTGIRDNPYLSGIISSNSATKSITMPFWVSQNSLRVAMVDEIEGSFIVTDSLLPVPKELYGKSKILIKKPGDSSYIESGWFTETNCTSASLDEYCDLPVPTEEKTTDLTLTPDSAGVVTFITKIESLVRGNNSGYGTHYGGWVLPPDASTVIINWNRLDNPPVVTAELCGYDIPNDPSTKHCENPLPPTVKRLKCETTYSDPEGDDPASEYAWTVDGETFDGGIYLNVDGWSQKYAHEVSCTYTATPISPSMQPAVSATSSPKTTSIVPWGGGKLELHLPFDDDLQDRSGNNNTTTAQGAMNYVDGKMCKALSLDPNDGTTEYVEVANSLSINPEEELTLSAWVLPKQTETFNPVISKKKTNSNLNNGYNLSAQNLNEWLRVSTETDSTLWGASQGNEVLPNQWSLLTVTFDGSVGKFYVNGQFKNVQAIDLFSGIVSKIRNRDGPLFVGRDTRYGHLDRYFNGYIDDVRVYSKALTSQEVLDLYNLAPTGCGGPAVSCTVNAPTTENPFRMQLGTNAQFSVSCMDNSGNLTTCPAGRTWSSTVPERAAVDSTGLVSALSNGSATINATAGSISCAGESIVVFSNPVPGCTINVSPSNEIDVGGIVSLNASGSSFSPMPNGFVDGYSCGVDVSDTEVPKAFTGCTGFLCSIRCGPYASAGTYAAENIVMKNGSAETPLQTANCGTEIITVIAPPSGTCGNETCDVGETNSTCEEDCFCGNNTCDVDETAATCTQDCGSAGDVISITIKTVGANDEDKKIFYLGNPASFNVTVRNYSASPITISPVVTTKTSAGNEVAGKNPITLVEKAIPANGAATWGQAETPEWADFGKGVFIFNAIVEQQENETYLANNSSTAVFSVGTPPRPVSVPDIHPAFVAIIALIVLAVVSYRKK